MNIAFLTTLNPADINNWSGTTFHLFHALSRKHHVKVIGQNTLLQAAYFTKDNYIKKNPLENYVSVFMGHRTKRILRIERKEYQTY